MRHCKHCGSLTTSRADWCINKPECQAARKAYVNGLARQWHRDNPGLKRPKAFVPIDPMNPPHDRKCDICGKPAWPNRNRCRECNAKLTNQVASGFEGFSPATETSTLLLSLFAGPRAGECRKRGAI